MRTFSIPVFSALILFPCTLFAAVYDQPPAAPQAVEQQPPTMQPGQQPSYQELQEQLKRLQEQMKEKEAKPAVEQKKMEPPPPVQKSEELKELEAKAKGAVTPDEAGVGNDRIMTVQTAETLKAGKMSISDYELGLLQFSYGITDRVQFSLMFTVPILQIGIMPSIKYRFLDTNILKMSVTVFAGVGLLYAVSNIAGGGGGATLAMDVCLDGGKCASIFTVEGQVFGGAAGSYDFNGDSGVALTFNVAAGVQGRVADKVKLLAELTFSGARARGSDGGGMFSINYGVRIHGTEFAADLGFMRPVFVVDFRNNDVGTFESNIMKYLPMGFPYLAFTYQW